eukprot:6454042-Amphidinium_carterae.1
MQKTYMYNLQADTMSQRAFVQVVQRFNNQLISAHPLFGPVWHHIFPPCSPATMLPSTNGSPCKYHPVLPYGTAMRAASWPTRSVTIAIGPRIHPQSK